MWEVKFCDFSVKNSLLNKESIEVMASLKQWSNSLFTNLTKVFSAHVSVNPIELLRLGGYHDFVVIPGSRTGIGTWQVFNQYIDNYI